MRNTLVILCIALALYASAAKAGTYLQARMYNLSTGEVVTGACQSTSMGRSTLTLGPTNSGESFTGVASDIDTRAQRSPYGSLSAFTSSAYADTYLSASRDRNATPGYTNRSVKLVGTQGTVLNVTYLIGPSGEGEGQGSDNKGVTYRLQLLKK